LEYSFDVKDEEKNGKKWKQLVPKDVRDEHKKIVSKSSSSSVTNAIHIATT
jgi:hypothetical protein